MTDEKVDTKKEDDAIVSSDEVKSIEEKLLAGDKAKEDALRKEIEEKLRKEMEQEQKMKELESEKEKLEAAVKKQAEEKAALEESKNKELEEAKSQIGTSKQVVHRDNPFARAPNPNAQQFADNLTPEQVKEIDDNSKKAFFNKLGITTDDW